MLFLSLLNFGAVEVILMLRVWILWEKSRTIRTLLIVVFVSGLILGLGLIHLNIQVGNVFHLSAVVSDLVPFQYAFPLAEFRELA